VRKEYDAELAENIKRGHIARNKFETTYPKTFSIDKGTIARIETIFAQRPWIASRGETKCQADFLDHIQDGFEPNLIWYRNLIGKVILVRHTTELARGLDIGEGRSCIVEYACTIISWSVGFPEFLERIHTSQSVMPVLDEKIKSILKNTHNFFISLGTDRSIKEHAKREDIWKKFVEEANLKGWTNA
jgi:hypothetical protein